MSMKNSNDTIGNQTRDLPACTSVPLLTAPSGVPSETCSRDMSEFLCVKFVFVSVINEVEVFKYLGTNLTNQNSIPEEIKSRLRPGNACYHSVQNLLSSRLLSKNLKIKIDRTIILPVVLYGCEAWSLTLWEERKLRVFENMVLRRIFGCRGDEVMGDCRRLHNEELNDLYSSPNIVRVIKSRRMRWAGHVARMSEERGCIGSWWGNRRERDHWGDLGLDG